MPNASKILLVGDASDPDGFAAALEKRGHAVRRASTFELRFAAAQEQPDLVAVDVDAGRLGDTELALLLSDHAVDCPVVLFGRRAALELQQLAAGCGAAASFPRPGEPEPFADGIEKLAPGVVDPRTPEPSVDFVALARESSRTHFVAVCPFPFLLGGASLVSSRGPNTAGVLDARIVDAVDVATRDESKRAAGAASGATGAERRRDLIVRAVRPASAATSERFSVGREPGVDILIEHATVSKVHAHFVRVPGGLKLQDAGSRNGTWAAGRLLAKDRLSPLLESGDGVRLGELELTFASSSSAWDRLRVNAR